MLRVSLHASVLARMLNNTLQKNNFQNSTDYIKYYHNTYIWSNCTQIHCSGPNFDKNRYLEPNRYNLDTTFWAYGIYRYKISKIDTKVIVIACIKYEKMCDMT